MGDIEESYTSRVINTKSKPILETQEASKVKFSNVFSGNPILSVITFILNSKDITKNKSNAIFKIPSHNFLENTYIGENEYYEDILPLAITKILSKFNFTFGDELLKQIQNTKGSILRLKFESSQRNLSVFRTIEINLKDNNKELKLLGQEPVNEKDGAINIIFDIEKYPGKLDEKGKIDFTEINSYPSVPRNTKLLEIINPGKGKKGITFNGRVIKYNLGKKYEISAGPGIEKEYIPEENKYIYKSNTNGVVIIKYIKTSAGGEKPISMNVEKNIKIPEVSYNVGNIGNKEIPCYANIKVIYDIKPNFKIFCSGDIEVGGSIKGELNVDGNIKANSIDTGSIITTTGNILTNFINDGKLKSTKGYIRTLKEVKNADIESPLIFMSNTACSSNVYLKSNIIYMNNALIMGNIIIDLGKELFETRVKLLDNIELIKKTIVKIKAKEKDYIYIIHEDLKSKFKILVNIFEKSNIGKKLDLKPLKSIITNILNPLLDFNIPLIYKGLEKLNDYSLKENITYSDWIPNYLFKIKKFLPLYKIKKNKENDLEELNEKINVIETELDKNIIISIDGKIKNTGKLTIIYGDQVFDIKIDDDKKVQDLNIHKKFNAKKWKIEEISLNDTEGIIKGIIKPLLKR